jgi:integrase
VLETKHLRFDHSIASLWAATKGECAKTFRESFKLVRKAAGLPTVGFRDLRHYFIAYGVMAGIDFMTFARWVGHRDGGMLIGRVYGEVANEHRQKMASQ